MSIYLVSKIKHGENNTRAINDIFQVQLLRAVEDICPDVAYEYDTAALVKLESDSVFCLSRFIGVEDKLEELMKDFIIGMKFTEAVSEIEVLFVNWDDDGQYGELYRAAMSSDLIMRTKSRRVNSTDSAEDKEKFIKQILNYGDIVDGDLREELENILNSLLDFSRIEESTEESSSRSSAEALWMVNAAKAMVSLEEKINKLSETIEKIEKKVFNE